MVAMNPTLFLFWNYFCITRIFSLETLNEEKLLIMEQDDPVLVEILKNEYLLPPPPRKFPAPKSMLDLNGQVGQPIKVNDQIFKNKIKKGFYIEAGAYDGQQWSNSLFYEVEKGWDGLLVEAHPEAFNRMKKRVK